MDVAIVLADPEGPITDVGLPGGLNGRQVADAARGTRPGLEALSIAGDAETPMIGGDHLPPFPPGMQALIKPPAVDALTARVRDLLRDLTATPRPCCAGPRPPAGPML